MNSPFHASFRRVPPTQFSTQDGSSFIVTHGPSHKSLDLDIVHFNDKVSSMDYTINALVYQFFVMNTRYCYSVENVWSSLRNQFPHDQRIRRFTVSCAMRSSRIRRLFRICDLTECHCHCQCHLDKTGKREMFYILDSQLVANVRIRRQNGLFVISLRKDQSPLQSTRTYKKDVANTAEEPNPVLPPGILNIVSTSVDAKRTLTLERKRKTEQKVLEQHCSNVDGSMNDQFSLAAVMNFETSDMHIKPEIAEYKPEIIENDVRPIKPESLEEPPLVLDNTVNVLKSGWIPQDKTKEVQTTEIDVVKAPSQAFCQTPSTSTFPKAISPQLLDHQYFKKGEINSFDYTVNGLVFKFMKEYSRNCYTITNLTNLLRWKFPDDKRLNRTTIAATLISSTMKFCRKCAGTRANACYVHRTGKRGVSYILDDKVAAKIQMGILRGLYTIFLPKDPHHFSQKPLRTFKRKIPIISLGPNSTLPPALLSVTNTEVEADMSISLEENPDIKQEELEQYLSDVDDSINDQCSVVASMKFEAPIKHDIPESKCEIIEGVAQPIKAEPLEETKNYCDGNEQTPFNHVQIQCDEPDVLPVRHTKDDDSEIDSPPVLRKISEAEQIAKRKEIKADALRKELEKIGKLPNSEELEFFEAKWKQECLERIFEENGLTAEEFNYLPVHPKSTWNPMRSGVQRKLQEANHDL